MKTQTSNRLIHEIRRKRPGLAKRADNGTPSSAIRLFCLECFGGSATDVSKCTAKDCPLFIFRFGRGFRSGPKAGQDCSE